ncbi:hypothetical protein BD310DRAFT_929590 [Dichomitus squalens]|uniref:Uncharacterized protein n=1 Tax=Dichomitus squalens TaxID=114155 RepID=A0A4Q9PSH2_9APHY|nr:hypothetical protein BD310DRAFT_929590 [Dichomitus squalens]
MNSNKRQQTQARQALRKRKTRDAPQDKHKEQSHQQPRVPRPLLSPTVWPYLF